MKLVLLPGLDGTGDLFARCTSRLPTGIEPVVIRYPNQAWGYEQLLPFVMAQLPVNEPFALLGESFSGPLAISIASQYPANLQALILVCTFARSPQPVALRLALTMRYLPPLFVQRIAVKYGLTHGIDSQSLGAEVVAAVQTLSASTIWARLEAIAQINVIAHIQKIQCPALYLKAKQDRLIPKSCLNDLTQHAKSLQVAAVQGPHCLLQSNPMRCVEVIASFLGACTLNR